MDTIRWRTLVYFCCGIVIYANFEERRRRYGLYFIAIQIHYSVTESQWMKTAWDKEQNFHPGTKWGVYLQWFRLNYVAEKIMFAKHDINRYRAYNLNKKAKSRLSSFNWPGWEIPFQCINLRALNNIMSLTVYSVSNFYERERN